MDNQTALRLLKEIVQTETVLGQETLVANKLVKVFDSAKIPCKKINYGKNRDQLVATLKGIDDGPVLGFSGHMDVVPVGENPWERDPFEAVEEDGLLYGRGTCDMKAGLIAQVVALLRLKEAGAPFKGTVKLLLTVGEETSAIGAAQMTNLGFADDLDALVIGEPTSLDVVIAHKGALWPQFTTYGKTSHGSMPEHGINAINHMLELINHFNQKFDFSQFEDKLLGTSTSSLNIFQGGNGSNVVPDKCVTTVDIRTVPAQNHSELKQDITALVEKVGKQIPDFKADVEFINDLPAIRTEPDHPFTLLTIEVIKEITSRTPQVKSLTGYTDGSQFGRAQKDFPILIVGPGDVTMAHQPNEYVSISEFYQMIEVNYAIAMNFLNN